MSKNEQVIKEVGSNLIQISDYLESLGPDGLIDHLSAVALNLRYVETVKLLLEYTSVLEQPF